MKQLFILEMSLPVVALAESREEAEELAMGTVLGRPVRSVDIRRVTDPEDRDAFLLEDYASLVVQGDPKHRSLAQLMASDDWEKLRQGIDELHKKRRAEVEEHRKRYSEAMGAITARINARLDGAERYVSYSAYETKDDIPIDNLDEQVIEGPCVLKNDGWDKTAYSEPMKDLTWLDVAVAANALISATGDFRHAFLEGVDKTDETRGGVPVYDLVMGS